MEHRILYFVGTLPTSPFQNITLGGICFPQYVNDVSFEKESNVAVNNRKLGDVIELDDEQVQKIKEAAKRKVIRWNVNNTRAFIVEKNDKKYRPQPNDKSIGEYVYLIAVELASKWNPLWRDKTPKYSLYEMIKAEEKAKNVSQSKPEPKSDLDLEPALEPVDPLMPTTTFASATKPKKESKNKKK